MEFSSLNLKARGSRVSLTSSISHCYLTHFHSAHFLPMFFWGGIFSMKSIGVYFLSQYGQTAKVASSIASTLEKQGPRAVLYDVSTLPNRTALVEHDGYVMCGAMYASKFKKKLRELLSRNRDILSCRPSAFVSLSLSAAGKGDQKLAAEKVARELFFQVGWEPRYLFNVAGALSYPKYGFFTRLMMKRISRKEGGPTDVNKEFELTDWNEVQKFANDFALLKTDSEFLIKPRERKAEVSNWRPSYQY